MGAGGFVRQHSTVVTAQYSPAREFDHIGAAVVVDQLGLAFNVFIHQIALFPVKSQLARRCDHRSLLVTFGVLPHIDPLAPNDCAAFGNHHVARKNAGLLEVVVAQGIGFSVHRLVAVCFFGSSWHGKQPQRGHDCDNDKTMIFHKGTNLAACVFAAL